MKPLLSCIAVTLVLTAGQPNAASAESSPQPNIVIILADDLGWGDVGYHGGRAETPHVDSLAREGVRLDNFHVCPLCSPTRAGLMTGRWPIRCGMGEAVITPWRQWGLPTTESTLADLVASAGYQNRGIVGKWHLGHYRREYLPLNRGFTFFYGHYNGALDYFTHLREQQLDWHRNSETCRDAGYSTELFGREASQFIRDCPSGRPFFLYVPFNAPHNPLQAKPEDLAKYAEIENEKERTYCAMIDCMDQAIGRILKTLDDRGLRENTLVWFISDNGAVSSYGDNGDWRGGKGSVYEGGVRVPSIIRWPRAGLAGGRSVDAMMGMIDVYPTIQRIVGAELPGQLPLDGRDMLDVMRGNATEPQRNWYSYIAQGSPDRIAVCDGTWKLVVLGGSVLDLTVDQTDAPVTSGFQDGYTVELFRLDTDPGEEINLVDQHPAEINRLLGQLKDFRALKLDGVPGFMDGRQGFVAPEDWVIPE